MGRFNKKVSDMLTTNHIEDSKEVIVDKRKILSEDLFVFEKILDNMSEEEMFNISAELDQEINKNVIGFLNSFKVY